MNILWRFLVVSFLIWLIPFVVSIPFFDRAGQLTINFWVFKALMATTLIGSAFPLFHWLYRSLALPNRHWTIATGLGLGALSINILLDMITVIPFTNMAVTDYIVQIAVLYLFIPIISVYIGINATQITAQRRINNENSTQ